MSINFSIFGIDFDSHSYGYKEDFKSIIKMNNEKNLLNFSRISNGTVTSMIEVHPVSLFNGTLSIGDSQNYSNVIEIMVQRYPRTRLAKAVSAHRYNVWKEQPTSIDNNEKNEHFSEVSITKSYKIEEDGSEKEIAKEDIESGYIFGKTIIPTSVIDKEAMKYETDTELTILGFMKNKSFPRFIAIGESNIIVPAKTNLNAKISLSSLIHAMLKTDTLALARIK
ncbi:hypothetical protein PCK2_000032 [Pneumocystis canis]|nr:hypothetical protein PCK2_000032 [Pneumocystis canis]